MMMPDINQAYIITAKSNKKYNKFGYKKKQKMLRYFYLMFNIYLLF